MNNDFRFEFYDEPVTKSCYDVVNKIIEVQFEAYYDSVANTIIKKPCTFIIQDWEAAKFYVGPDDNKLYELEDNMESFSMIYYREWKGSELEIFVNTMNGRYIGFLFTNPKLSYRL